MGKTKELIRSGYIRALNVWCEQQNISFANVCPRNYNTTTNTFDLYLKESKKTLKMYFDGNKINRA
jgi:hypothetical protein